MPGFADYLIQWGPPLMLLLGVFGAMFIMLSFNLKTNEIVERIQALESKEGRTWPFWTDECRLVAFVLRPETLLDKGDSQQVLVAKQSLIGHRKLGFKRVLQGVTFLLISWLAAIAIPVTFALLG